jgi:hypothetical protein
MRTRPAATTYKPVHGSLSENNSSPVEKRRIAARVAIAAISESSSAENSRVALKAATMAGS